MSRTLICLLHLQKPLRRCPLRLLLLLFVWVKQHRKLAVALPYFILRRGGWQVKYCTDIVVSVA